MTKKKLVDSINQKFDWFERMQKPLGHDSWWYSNRSSEDCVNVKIHAWVDVDEIRAKLTKKELKIIDTLGIDFDELINNMIWNEMVEMARVSLEEELKEKFNVSKLDYGGRSGGWLCVVYSWEDIPDDYDVTDNDKFIYNYKELQEFAKIINRAEIEASEVNCLVEKRKKQLCEAIEDPKNYIEEVKEFLSNRIEAEKLQAEKILTI